MQLWPSGSQVLPRSTKTLSETNSEIKIAPLRILNHVNYDVRMSRMFNLRQYSSSEIRWRPSGEQESMTPLAGSVFGFFVCRVHECNEHRATPHHANHAFSALGKRTRWELSMMCVRRADIKIAHVHDELKEWHSATYLFKKIDFYVGAGTSAHMAWNKKIRKNNASASHPLADSLLHLISRWYVREAHHIPAHKEPNKGWTVRRLYDVYFGGPSSCHVYVIEGSCQQCLSLLPRRKVAFCWS